MPAAVLNVGYLLVSVLFILALKGMAHPRTAVRGNLLGASGMLLAIVLTLVSRGSLALELIIVGLAVGALIGGLLALNIRMTAMPQLVAVLNGAGGGSSALVAGIATAVAFETGAALHAQIAVATAASGTIGGLTFWGSLVAFGKLQGLINEPAARVPGGHATRSLLGLAVLGAGIWVGLDPAAADRYWALVGLASLLGVVLVLPIGGADMPVVIAFLNSCSGLAAAATGFVLSNTILIIAGSLVGASGLILARHMCRAMNRRLVGVLLQASPSRTPDRPAADQAYTGRIKTASPDEVGLLLVAARTVTIVPGYGLAVAQAQHAVAELASQLQSRGAQVVFAIHPVAGRMPGHMNVLLAEANVDYERLKDLDEANLSFPETDVALVIGANDVVNPGARTDTSGPLAGMPILDADKARTVVVIKRSLSPGFAGVTNPLFTADNTLLVFGDAKAVALALIEAVESA